MAQARRARRADRPSASAGTNRIALSENQDRIDGTKRRRPCRHDAHGTHRCAPGETGMTRTTGRAVRSIALAALAALALPLLSSGALAQIDDESVARFEFFTKCAPLALLVQPLGPEAHDIGLTQEAIQTAIENRLRSARLYTQYDRQFQYLNVSIHVLPRSFSVTLQLNKFLWDSLLDEWGYATTWHSAGTGTHGRDANYILSSLSRSIDNFLVRYLRVNEEACATR